MEGHILDVDYIDSNNKSCIRLFLHREETEEVILDNFKPYFFMIPKGNIHDVKNSIDNKLKETDLTFSHSEIVNMKISGNEKELLKLFFHKQTDVAKGKDFVLKEMKSAHDVHEYDINFYKSFMIDNDLDGAGKIKITDSKIETMESTVPDFKVLSFDIESYEEAGESSIIMISIYTPNKKYILSYRKTSFDDTLILENEKQLLQKFVEIINDENPDIILTYNGDEFDFNLLIDRSKNLGVSLDISRDDTGVKFSRRGRSSVAKINGRVHIDLFSFVRNVLSMQLQTETLNLDSIASELLGDEKIEMEFEEILETWRTEKDLAKLAEYCMKDSELTYKLGDIILPQIYAISNLIGQTIFDTSRLHYGQMTEWYLMRRSHRENEVIPSSPKWHEIQKRRKHGSYIGGYVKEPIPGVHEDIAILDFRSLYPSIIASFNISPDTLHQKNCKDIYEVPEVGHKFCNDKQGFVSGTIKYLIDRRSKIKQELKSSETREKTKLKNIAQALKLVANALYGMFAFHGARWYSKECAESSSALGRFYIRKVINMAEKNGFDVVYSDTDSIFIKGKDIESSSISFLETVNKELPGMLELDFQGIYTRGIFIPKGVGGGTAKKRYALVDKEGDLTIRGLERVRKDWSNIARQTQENVLKFILEKNDLNGAIEHVRKTIHKTKEKKFDIKDFIIHEQLTKPLSEYKQIGPHVSAARKLKENNLPMGEGMTVMYVITKGKGSISENSEPIELASLDDIDPEYYVKKQIIPATLRVLQVLGVNEEKLLGSGLERFLSKKKK